MSWMLGLIVVLIAALAGAGLWACAVVKGKATPIPEQPRARSGKPVTSKSRQDLAMALQRLATTPPPPTQEMGAMCYEMAPQPKDQVTYICPRDGTRVVYSSEEELGYLALSIHSLRGQVRNLQEQGLDATLDERALCPKCAKRGQPPQVDLLITFAGEDGPHRLAGVSTDDLEVLEELLAGSLTHDLEGPDSEPLQKHLPRLREMLGIPEPSSSGK